jgi:small subunit ribosomal protein S8
MINDPIGDMLTRVRNGLMAGKADVLVPMSRIKADIARILKEEGFIEDVVVLEPTTDHPFQQLLITLKYYGARRERQPVITNIQRVSKPGRRVYRGSQDMPRVLSGTGIAIVTTPKGVMTAQQARREHVGGEVLCYVW